jgi:uncharacterized protein (TIRG00374 family)
VQWTELKQIFTQIRWTPIWLSWAVSLAAFFLRGLRWQILIGPFQKIQVFQLIRWQVGGLVINNLLPLRMGEFARAYWAGHKSSISKSSVLATIVAERLADLSCMAVVALILLSMTGLLKSNSFWTPSKGILLILTVIILGAGLKWVLSKYTLRTLLTKLQNKVPHRLYSILENFIHGLKVFKDKNEIIKIAVLTPVIWSIDIGVVAVFSRTLGLDLSWTQSGLVVVGLILGVMVPAAPGAAGTFEAGGVAVLTLLGFSNTLAFSFVLLLHTFQYLTVLVMGIPVLLFEGFSPKKIFENGGNNQIKKKGEQYVYE